MSRGGAMDPATVFVDGLAARAQAIVDQCSRCGRCVEVCPTAGPAGVDRRDPVAVVTDVIEILRGDGDPRSAGALWAQTCTGSGRCIEACGDGVNPRFMLAMARVKLHHLAGERDRRDTPASGSAPRPSVEAERRAAGQQAFNTMSQAVKVLSRLQLPGDLVDRVTRSAHADAGSRPDLVLYLGCNVMRTPHIALLCMEVLDRIGASYRVFGGPANCCGVIQFRSGDPRTGGQVGTNTVTGFAGTGASRVLTWCPTCNIQLGEIVMPVVKPDFALEHVVPYIADRLDALRPHLVRPVPWRVALHEHPGVAGVSEAVAKILRAIPGLTLVDLEQPRVGYMCNSLAPVPAYKRQLHEQELRAAEAARVDALVGIYHACHRELCAHEATSPFRVVNFLEVVGEAMGIERPDLFKDWKKMQDVDRVLAEVARDAEAAGLDLGAVRQVMTAVLAEQPLPVRR